MKLKTISEIAEESLKQYKGMDDKPLFTTPEKLVITDGIFCTNFKIFINRLEEDYTKHLAEYDKSLMDDMYKEQTE